MGYSEESSMWIWEALSTRVVFQKLQGRNVNKSGKNGNCQKKAG
jgi:hypothetical protein